LFKTKSEQILNQFKDFLNYSNVAFLLAVSYAMSDTKKLRLLKPSFKLLPDKFMEKAIVATIVKDLKFQIEFNPYFVAEYSLIE